MQKEHALVPERIADTRARFKIGCLVWKFVVRAECLSPAPRANGAVEVQLLRHNVLPDGVDRMQIFRLAGKRGDIRHTAVQISGAHGMAHRLALPGHRKVRLEIRARRFHLAALDKFARLRGHQIAPP